MYLKQCKCCGSAFETGNYQQLKCKPSCGRLDSHVARVRKKDLHELTFIGVDGEGVNVWRDQLDVDSNGEEYVKRVRDHHYVLLSVGDQSLHKNGAELTHDDIFTFLWDQYLANPDAVFVGFYLGYDFTNWLKSIPYWAAKSLLTKEGIAKRKGTERYDHWPVRDGRWGYQDGKRVLRNAKWEFDVMAGKRFKLRPYVPYDQIPETVVTHKDGTQEVKKVTRPWMYICDTGPFFQSSFLTAIDPKNWETPILTDEEYEVIREGKEHRQNAQLDDAMITYNLLENDVLARLMQRVNEGFVTDGIRLGRKQWFGPGQAAQMWMRNIGVPTGEEIRETVPVWARDAARKCYYGGWFEIFNHGPVPGISYAYDINSAYPAVIANLPCLLHGKWSQGIGKPGRLPARALRMLYVTAKGKDEWVGALPYRKPDGAILRPREVKGWYWAHEVKAAQRAGLISNFTVHQWVTYQPCKCDPPMASIRELYEGRLSIGKNSAAGKGKKLVYNSAYGKLAQSVGNPKYSNSIWASLITAGCRTQILDAIATHPTKTASLLMVATDGIVFKEPHPNLDIHPTRLGAWDADEYHNLSLFMPGLYWDDKTREQIAKNKVPKLKSRGVSARDMSRVINRVDKAWQAIGADNPAPVIYLPIEWAMTTAKQAITRNAWWTCGQITYGGKRILNGRPDAKRAQLVNRLGALGSLPYQWGPTLETTYYEKAFGETFTMDDEVAEMVTPDGSIGDLQAWAFRR